MSSHDGELYCATCNTIFPLENCANFRPDQEFCGGSCRQAKSKDFDQHTCACGSTAGYWMPPEEPGRLGYANLGPQPLARSSWRNKELTDEELLAHSERVEKEKARLTEEYRALFQTCSLCHCLIQFETCPCASWKEAEEKLAKERCDICDKLGHTASTCLN